MRSAKKPRGLLVAGNWKMNHGFKEADEFFMTMKQAPDAADIKSSEVEICILPPTLLLEHVRELCWSLPFPVSTGAQNAHWEKAGAFTGEVSGPQLKDIEIQWAMVGHSERRQYFGETNETVKKRAESLLSQGFKVILCIGETREEREKGKTSEVLSQQVKAALPSTLDGTLVIAYEPVWAIGTGLTATTEQAEEAHVIIRGEIGNRFGADAAAKTPILYGGSVTPQNALSLMNCGNIDGVLVGGASLKAESFLGIIRAASQILI